MIAVDPAGNVRTVVADGEMIDGRPYGYADGIAIASDGRIVHTQGTTAEWTGSAARHFVANSGPGRLLVTDPQSGVTQTLIDGLSFGNGIVLAPDESYVRLAVGRCGVMRWLSARDWPSKIFTDYGTKVTTRIADAPTPPFAPLCVTRTNQW